MNIMHFDDVHFRRVIAKSPSSLRKLLAEGNRFFYNEYDYHPNLAVCASGTFTIMGEYMELAEGYIAQAAMPFATIILARWNDSPKCRLFTCSSEIDPPKKILFSAAECKPLKKGYPKWANLVKGIANLFPRKSKKGLDALIHSNIPVSKGFGSSAAVQAAFYTLFSDLTQEKSCESNNVKAQKCSRAEKAFGEQSSGIVNNFTVFFAESREAVVVNTGGEEVETFTFHDPNILFLLLIPQTNTARVTTNLIRMRETELKLAAKLLDLEHIKYAGECHLEVLSSMTNPTREEVLAILRKFENDEEYIHEFLEELYKLEPPKDFSSYEFGGEEELGSKDTPSSLKMPNIEEEEPEVEGAFATEFKYKMICDETLCLGPSELSLDSKPSVLSKLRRRMRYIITENLRLRSFVMYIKRLDFISAGMELTRSHLSLKVDFEVSNSFLDKMVYFAANREGVYGSKMMRNGGMLSLLHRNAVDGLIEDIKNNFGDVFEFCMVFPNQGVQSLLLSSSCSPTSVLSGSYTTVEELWKEAVENFQAMYQHMPTHGFFAPAVLNVLGMYSSHNQGHSLSMAVNVGTVVVGALNGSGKIRVATMADNLGFFQKKIFQIPSIEPLVLGRTQWANHVKGIINYFKGAVPGFDCLIKDNIFLRGRVSEGASLKIALYGFLEELTGTFTTNVMEKANYCMKGEQEFTNTVCGIDDFIVALKGIEGKMMAVDCKRCTSLCLPFFDQSIVFILIHDPQSIPAPSKGLLYRRLEECNDVAKALGYCSLLWVKKDSLKGLDGVYEEAIKRASHVISEEERVVEGICALRKFNINKFGELMVASHISLRDDFKVSCSKVDNIVERSMEVNGVIGARMTGIEYRSSALCLVKRWAVDDLIDHIRNTVEEGLEFYILTPSDGSKRLDIKSYIASLSEFKLNFKKVFKDEIWNQI